MKITKITVNNFRSIKFAEISPADFNVFVGQNNHGKTNFFESIEWFYNGKGNIDEIRCGRKGDAEVSVEVEFDGIQEGIQKMKNEKNQTSIKKVLGNADSVRVKRTSTAPKTRLIFDPQNNNWLEKNPTGFDSAFNDFLPKFEYVSTKTQLEDVAKYGKNTPIAMMLSGVLTAILEESASYREFKEKFDKLFGDETSDVRVELDSLSGKVKIYLEKQFPDTTKVEFEVAQPMFEDLLKNFNTTIDDGIKTNAYDKGDGMQRALMLAIIQAYADFRKEHEDTNKMFLFFIDEGELHLHPTAQRSLKRALVELAERGDQVFINTHSSVLVTDEDDKQLIFKVEKSAGMSDVNPISKEDKPYIVYDLLGGSPADLLLPRNFLIVEGKSEAAFIAKVIERFYSDQPVVQVIYAEGDHEKQKRSMDGINTMFAPLFTNPVYKNNLVILCDTPHPDRQTDFSNFQAAYPYLEQQEQLYVIAEQNLEEYYPAPWQKTQAELPALNTNNGKLLLAREAGDGITQTQFESDMPLVFTALQKCWDLAYKD